VPPERAGAFAPGRVNLIGEHTDYNGGLALPFAISQGIVVHAQASAEEWIRALAVDLDEEDAFALTDRARCDGWRAFVRGTVAELDDAGTPSPGARLQIGGDLPRGAGLSSSAALEVALCLALLALSGERVEPLGATDSAGRRLEIAQLCDSNAASAITSPSSRTYTVISSPHRGLSPSADTASCSIVR